MQILVAGAVFMACVTTEPAEGERLVRPVVALHAFYRGKNQQNIHLFAAVERV